MSKYADEMRERSATMLQGGAALLRRLEHGSDILRNQLANAQAQTTLDAMRAHIDQAKDSLDASTDLVRVVQATACIVTGNVLDALADQVDFLMGAGALKTVVDKLRTNAAKQAAIRLAASQGNWDEFNRLAADAISELADGNLPAGSGSAEHSSGSGGTGSGDTPPAGASGGGVG